MGCGESGPAGGPMEGAQPMTQKQFTLTAVRALADGVLALTYADGEQLLVDIKPIIARHPSLRALATPGVFRRARLGEFGASVTWGSDALELAADNLRARAIEQAGGDSHGNEMRRDRGCEGVGVSRRMLAYYRSGTKPVPRTVALACLGWEAEQQMAAWPPGAAEHFWRLHGRKQGPWSVPGAFWKRISNVT